MQYAAVKTISEAVEKEEIGLLVSQDGADCKEKRLLFSCSSFTKWP